MFVRGVGEPPVLEPASLLSQARVYNNYLRKALA
jgi:hypothetical protein